MCNSAFLSDNDIACFTQGSDARCATLAPCALTAHCLHCGMNYQTLCLLSRTEGEAAAPTATHPEPSDAPQRKRATQGTSDGAIYGQSQRERCYAVEHQLGAGATVAAACGLRLTANVWEVNCTLCNCTFQDKSARGCTAVGTACTASALHAWRYGWQRHIRCVNYGFDRYRTVRYRPIPALQACLTKITSGRRKKNTEVQVWCFAFKLHQSTHFHCAGPHTASQTSRCSVAMRGLERTACCATWTEMPFSAC
jgi:hypothetical protein